MEPQLTPEGRGPPLFPGMARPPGDVFSKQGLRRQDRPVAWDPASSSERTPAECDQNGPVATAALEPAHGVPMPRLPGSEVSDDGDSEFIEPALVEVDGTTTVIHEGGSSTLQPNAAPPLAVLSDDLGLLSTLFGSDEELAKPGVAPEGPEDVKKGRPNSTATVEGGNHDQFGPLPKSDVFGDLTQKDTQASVPLPPQATPLTAPAQNHPDTAPRFIDLPRIVKLKPSSITFSDYSSPDHTDSDYNRAEYACHSCRPVLFNFSSDGGASSQEEEENNDDDEEEDGDDDDDEDHGDEDVFLDHGAGPRCRGADRERRRRKQSKEVPSGAGRRPAERKTDCNGKGRDERNTESRALSLHGGQECGSFLGRGELHSSCTLWCCRRIGLGECLPDLT
ncbi:unnamed protein product [Arctogadus glacialis]